MRRIALCFLSIAFLGVSSAGEISLKTATDILTAHAIHDAIILVPGGWWHSSPALADLDGDGDLEIIVGGGAWHHDGRPVLGWQQRRSGGGRSLAVGDVDNDGTLEIAAPGYLWKADGSLMPGWPTKGCPNNFCTPCLADVDGDGDLEILSTDLELGVCVRHHDGTFLPGWPVSVPGNDVRATVLAHDVDGDGTQEIVFTRLEDEIRVYHLNGTPYRGFPRRSPLPRQQCFVFADVDGDGHAELVRGGKALDLMKGTMVMDMGGTGGEAPCLVRDPENKKLTAMPPRLPRRAQRLLPPDISGESGFWSDSAVAADIDGDGVVEVLFGNRKGGYHAYRQDGTQAAGWPKRLSPSGDCGMAVGDLDGDGYFEVVAPTAGGRIYVFGCPGPATGSAPWPQFMAGNLRNGVPDPAFSSRPPRIRRPLSPIAQELKSELASGNWKRAVEIYKMAVKTVERESKQLGEGQSKKLKQDGLLSIARILNTRAKRYGEAADFYRQAIEVAPNTWQACQALTECTDLVHLNLYIKEARDALDQATTTSLSALKTLELPEADIYRLAAGQASLLLGRPEAPSLLRSLEGSSSPLIAGMAKSYGSYEEIPFLLSFEEEKSYHVRVNAKDLTPETPVEGKVLYQLEINPHSPTKEPFPIQLFLVADKAMSPFLEDAWNDAPEGMLCRVIEQDLPSGTMSTYRCNRFTLLSRPYNQDVLTVNREVERLDNTHMQVSIFVESHLGRVEYGFTVYGTGARIIPSSVTPSAGAGYLNEAVVTFSKDAARATRDSSSSELSSFWSATIEAVVEIPEGMRCFYPEVMVRAWGGGEDIDVQPRTPTQRIRGFFEGVDYELVSTRLFKLRSAKTDIFWAFILEKMDTDR